MKIIRTWVHLSVDTVGSDAFNKQNNITTGLFKILQLLENDHVYIILFCIWSPI